MSESERFELINLAFNTITDPRQLESLDNCLIDFSSTGRESDQKRVINKLAQENPKKISEIALRHIKGDQFYTFTGKFRFVKDVFETLSDVAPSHAQDMLDDCPGDIPVCQIMTESILKRLGSKFSEGLFTFLSSRAKHMKEKTATKMFDGFFKEWEEKDPVSIRQFLLHGLKIPLLKSIFMKLFAMEWNMLSFLIHKLRPCHLEKLFTHYVVN